ncbi:MAG: undecaprenyldiphospho-muramoylpentapeptide beta-N-acetylglucosaminyltransferase [bacterium]|nr:undecaprenyldiphospho-muramoylpentapeptide beta-N-acetylglucosaminyltransferase [bacterium]
MNGEISHDSDLGQDELKLPSLWGCRAVLTGGGTGGHLYPLLAIAEQWRDQYDGNLLFMGTEKGIENKIVPEKGYRFQKIYARGLSGGLIGKAKALLALGIGVLQSWSALRSFQPRVVVGSGGYVCAPVLLAAKLLGIPTVLLEQNARAGKTVRLLSRFANRICTCWPEAASTGLPADKVVLTGNPVRREVIQAEREAGRQMYDLPAERPCLLITGGSQGAASLDKAVLRALPLWRDCAWTVIHITGPKHLDKVKAEASPLLSGGNLDYRPVGYLQDMASAYAACDLVVCRAGATTLCEIMAVGRASIVVPYPYAAENHQEANAASLVEAGGAVRLADDQVEEELAENVLLLMNDAEKRQGMAEASRRQGRPEAVQAVLQAVADSLCGC